jgi:hypothetical protein
MILIAELLADPEFCRALRDNHDHLMQTQEKTRCDETKPFTKEIKEKTQ